MSTRNFSIFPAACFFLALVLTASNIFAGKPIPNGKDAYTAAQFDKDYFAYREGQLDLYEKHAKDSPEMRKPAAAFNLGHFQCFRGMPDAPTAKELNEKADTLLAAGEEDPLVLANIGAIKLDVGKNAEAKKILAKAHEKFASSSYPACCKFRGINRLRSAFLATQTPVEEWMAYRPDFIRLLVENMEEAALEPKNRRYIWIGLQEYLVVRSENMNSFPLQTSIYEEVQKAEKMDPWMLNMVRGWHHYSLGWKMRGDGFASTVSAEGMKAFAENMAKASEYFTKAWETDPKIPDAAVMMIQVSMAEGDEKHSPRDWFDRAVEAQTDFDPAYSAYAFSMRPRWGGSHEEMFQFGLECLATNRFDTGVPEKLVQMLMNVDDEIGKKGEIWREDGVFESVKAVIEGVEKEPSRKEKGKLNPLDWDLSAFALIAAHARQFDDARAALDKLGEKLRLDAFLQFHMRYPYDIGRIYALTGSTRDEVREFDATVSDNGYRDPEAMKSTIAMFEKAAAKEADPKSKPYFDYWKTRLSWQDRFDNGEWVDIVFDKDQLMWERLQGTWIVEDERTIAGDAESNGGKHQLRCTVPFDAPFEIEGDLECVLPDKQMLVGLMIGNIWYTYGELGCMFSVNFDQKAAYFTGQTSHWAERFNLADPRKCHFRLRYWQSNFEFCTDSQSLSQQPFRDLPGFDSFALAYLHGKAKYRNLRIRKLGYGPPPAGEKFAERLTYYEEAIGRDSKDANAYMERGIAQNGLGNNEQGLADYRKAAELAPNWPKPFYFIAKHEFQRRNYVECADALEQYCKMIDDNPMVLMMRASILSTVTDEKIRNGKVAVECATKACELTGYKEFKALDVLAAAHAEAGNFGEALKWANKGLELAPEARKKHFRDAIELYKANTPFRMNDER